MSRAEKREALIAAIHAEDERTSELALCAAEVSACFVRWSMDACIRWSVELALDGCSKDQIEEAARVVARRVRDPAPADLTGEAMTLLQRAKLEERNISLDTERALPAITGDPHVNKLAASSTISDALAGLLRGEAEIEAEMEMRRRMNPEQIAERRAELGGRSGGVS